MTGLLRAELLKMRKRWMPYVLFALMLAGAAFFIWVIGYSTYKGDPEYSANGLRTFAYPYSVPALLDTGQFWASAIFVGILATSTVATEHNWGTIRPALSGGVSRAQYLATKLAALILVSTVALLLVFGFGLLLSFWATSAAGFDAPVPTPESFTAADFVLMVARTALCILPYGLLAFALTVISRSTALGIAGTMGYIMLEAIGVAVLATGGGIIEDMRILFIGQSVTSLMAENRFGDLENETAALRDINAEGLPGVWVATLIILLESAFLVAASFYVFLRRDVNISHG